MISPMIELYSKDSCKFCEMTKTLLTSKGIAFTEYKLGEHFTREEFVERYPYIRTMPAIFIDNEYVGGYTNIVEWVENYRDEL